MCTVLLPPGYNPIAVNKYIISYQKLLNLGSKEASLLSCEVSEQHFRSSWFEFQSDLEHILEFITK